MSSRLENLRHALSFPSSSLLRTYVSETSVLLDSYLESRGWMVFVLKTCSTDWRNTEVKELTFTPIMVDVEWPDNMSHLCY